MVDYSQDEYHVRRHPEFIKNGKTLMEAWSYYAYVKYIKPYSPRRLLEVGGALGYNLLHAKKNGIYCVMVEPSGIGRRHASDCGILAHASLDELGGQEFDLILVRHVLEHIIDPVDFLKKLKKNLAINGVLMLILPIENPYRKIDPNDMDHHLYCWNPQSLSNLCVESGFRVVKSGINSFNGRRALLPLWHMGLGNLYCLSMSILGKLRRSSEIVMVIS